MKIFVVGANGQIGRHLIKDLATTRHQVTAGVREVATQSLVKKDNVTYVSFDLTWTIEEMADAFKGCDCCGFAREKLIADRLRRCDQDNDSGRISACFSLLYD